MVFSYSTDEPTTVHKVRLLLADTNEKDDDGNLAYIFHDEEIQTLLDLNGDNIYATAADALEARVADLARAHAFKLGRAEGAVEVSVADSRKALQELAARWREISEASQPPKVHDWSLQALEDLEQGIHSRVYDSDYDERSATTFDS